jgi:C_GCAxxG_C_C family probable redox protein
LQEAQDYPSIWELASGFGGGIGRMQDVCGAVTGAVIAIGYRASQGRTDGREIAGAARAACQTLYRGFQEKFGAVDCRTITGYDFNDVDGYQQFQQSNTKNERCHPCVEYAVRAVLAEKE